MMIGAGNVLKKHAADHARRAAVTDEEAPEDDDLATCSHISFESSHSQCMENCGVLMLAVLCQGSDAYTVAACSKTLHGWKVQKQM